MKEVFIKLRYTNGRITYLHSVTFKFALFVGIHPITDAGYNNDTEDNKECYPKLSYQCRMLIDLYQRKTRHFILSLKVKQLS